MKPIIYIAISLLFISFGSFAAVITGPDPVTANVQYTYFFDNGEPLFSPVWTASGGTVLSGPTPFGSTQYSAIVTWTTVGTGTLTLKDGRTTFGTKNVSVESILNGGSINGTKTICYGASVGTLGNGSSASGGNGSLSYQWQYSSNGSSGWTNIGGGTGTSYAPGNLTATRYYRRRVISGSQTKYTGNVKITVRTSLSAGAISNAQSLCYNGDPSTLGSTSNASGGDGNYSYQWQYSANGFSGWTNISGATGTTYNPGPSTSTRIYRRRVISCGQTKYTSNIGVITSANLSAGSINNAQTLCYNGNPATIGSSSNATGGSGGYTYQWQYSTNGSSGWANISGATSTTYNPGALTSSRWYRRRVKSSNCSGYKYTSSMKITISSNLNAGGINGSKTICYNNSAGTLGSSSNASGGNNSYTYQWQYLNGSTWTNISGATGTTYAPGNLTSTRSYRRRVISCGQTKYTGNVTISVYGNLAAGSIGNAQTVCYSGNPSAVNNTSSATGGVSRVYQWQKSTTSASSGFANISGATGSAYDPSTSTQTTWYRRGVVSGAACGTKYTNAIKVTVYGNLTAGSISGAQTTCGGSTASLLNSTANAGGGNGSYSYQWETRSPGGSWGNISGAILPVYGPGALTSTKEFRRKVTSCNQVKYTSGQTVSISPTPGLAIGSNKSRCGTGAVTLTAATGSNGNNIRWYSAASGGTLLRTGTSYTTPSISSSTTYYAASYNSSTGCQDSDRKAITATINPIPGLASGSNKYRCGAGTQTLTATTGSNGNNIRWYNAASGGTLLHTGTSYTTPSIGSSTTYYAASYNSSTGCQDSDRRAITAVINPIPGLANGSNKSRCGTGTVTLTATTGSNGNSIRWYNVASGGILIHTGTSYTTPSISSSTTYYAASFNSATFCQDSDRRAITAVINQIPGLASGSNKSRCGTGAVTLTATTGSNGNNIRWYNAASGGTLLHTGTSYTTPSISSSTTYYATSYNSSGGCQDSDRKAITATINPAPSLASGSNNSRCGTGAVTLTATTGINGNNIRWYNATSGGTLLHTGTSYTTPSISSSTTYYAASYNSSTGCQDSDRRAIAAVINPIPGLASGNNKSRCGTGAVTLTATTGSNGNNIRWYSAASGGTLLRTGTSYTTPSISSSTTYYAASYNSSTGCQDSDRKAIAAVINAVPGLAIVTDVNICGPGDATLIASPGSNGTNVKWYSTPSGGEPLFTGTNYLVQNLNVSTTYYVSSFAGGCETTFRRPITAHVNLDPIEYSVTGGGSFCAGNSGPNIGLNDSQSGINYQLKLGSADIGGTIPGTGVAISFGNQTAEGIYTIEATNDQDLCPKAMNGSQEVILYQGLNPGAISSAQTICQGTSINPLSITTPVTGGDGSYAYQWQKFEDDNGIWEDIDFANFNTYNPGNLMISSDFRLEVKSCTYTEYTAKIEIVVNPAVGLAISNDSNHCGAGTVVFAATIGSNGNGIRWYAAPSGGAPVFTGLNYSIANLSSTTTYYATSYNSNTGCESVSRKAVTATINPIPGLASGSNKSRCGTGAVTLTATTGSNGNNIRWYSAASGGTLLHTGTSYTTPSISSSTTYYAASYNSSTGCQDSDRKAITATINPAPGLAIVTDVNICGPGDATLIASPGSNGTNVNWYSTPSGGEPLFTGTNYLVQNLNVSTTYYVSSFAGGCETTFRRPITAHVNLDPVAYSVTGGGSFCAGNSGPSIGLNDSQSGINYQLKLGSTDIGSTIPGTGVAISFGNQTAEGIYTIEATNDQDLCPKMMNGSQEVILYQGLDPVTISSAQTICRGTSMSPLSITTPVTGGDGSYAYQWQKFEDDNGTWEDIDLANFNIYNPGNLMISSDFRLEVKSCTYTEYTAKIEIVVNPAVGLAIGNDSNHCGAGTVVFAATIGSNGNGIRWYAAPSGGAPVFTGLNYSITNLSSTTTYYATSYNSNTGCESVSRKAITATINAVPGLASGSNKSLCGTGAVTLTATTGSNGNNIRWYSAASGGTLLHTGTSYTTPSINSSTTYYAASYNSSTGCQDSDRKAITATINPAPGLAIVTDVNICGPGDVTLIATPGTNGTNINWYSTPFGGEPLFTGTNYLVQSLNVSTTYYASSFGGGCETTLRKPITAHINVDPVEYSVIGEGSYCEGSGGAVIGLGGSQTNMNYQLKLGTTDVGSAMSGTGFIINFGNQTAEGVYTIEATNAQGLCPKMMNDSIVINRNALPIVDAGGDIQVFVGNSAFSFMDASPSGGLWTGMGIGVVNFNPSTAGIGNHLITYTYHDNVTGCSDVDTRMVTVASNPSIVLIGDQHMGQGETRSLGVDNIYASYQWSFNGAAIDGATLNTHEATSPGVYTVTITNSSGYDITTEPLSLFNVLIIQNRNYIRTTNFQAPSTELGPVLIPTLNKESVNISINYIDGLGRGVQNVLWQASPVGKDIVQPIEYDSLGRTIHSYLPYESTEMDASYKVDALVNGNNAGSAQFDFYQGMTPKIASDTRPFSETIYEPSPLNRVMEQFGPGEDWKVNSKSSLSKYETNDSTDSVSIWVIEGNEPTSSSIYSEGELIKNVTTDEEGYSIEEYMDKLGRTLLKKVETGDTTSPWTQTYYVYDDLNNLRFVLPPMIFETNETLDEGELDNFAFQYKYDNRRRMTEKKVPGAGSVSMVYDKWDRLVLTQDANQRFASIGATGSVWTFTKYDRLNRPILTGTYTYSESLPFGQPNSDVNQVEMQDIVNQFYIDAESNADTSYEVAGTFVHGYTNQSFPKVSWINNYFTVTYYDNYDYQNDPQTVWGTDYAYNDPTLSLTFNGISYDSEINANTDVRGQVTGSKVRNLANNTWLKSAAYYDDKYRAIQNISDNNLGAVDVNSNLYDFTGKVLQTKIVHDNGDDTTSILRTFDYDHADRLLSVKHSINGASDITIVQNEYNAIGELVDKKLHSTDNTNFMQSVDYRYNIRGWLTSMNNAAIDDSNTAINDDQNDYFGFELAYNNDVTGLSNTRAWNGNISAMNWSDFQSAGGVKERAYSYSYDAMNRLTDAQHHAKSSTFGAIAGYKVSGIKYDLNGNIELLKRNDGSGAPMDDLTYDYGSTKSNQLLNVTDAGHQLDGFKEDHPGTGQEYFYDENGNMTQDDNKGIDKIEYNYLNLPSKVIMDSANYIEYAYDAAGIKLQQKVYEASILRKTTDYIGEFNYETDSNGIRKLQFIQHEEGRIVPEEDNDMTYQYFLKDHLGNTRVAFTSGYYNSTFTAYMEDTSIDNDTTHFENTQASRVSYPPGGKAVMLNRVNPFGPSKMLTVSRGDTIAISVDAYYENASGFGDGSLGLVQMAALISGAFGAGGIGTESQTVHDLFNVGSGGPALLGGGSGDDTVPSAYLNYLLFDTSDSLVESGFFNMESGVNLVQTIDVSNLIINQPGYIYIYLSNESDSDNPVYFDNFTVRVSESPVLENTDYYPFGLTFGNGSSQWTPSPVTETLAEEDFTFTHGFEIVSGNNYLHNNRLFVYTKNWNGSIGASKKTIATQAGSTVTLDYYFNYSRGSVGVYVDGVKLDSLYNDGQKQLSFTGTGSDVEILYKLDTTYNSSGRYTAFLLHNFIANETLGAVTTTLVNEDFTGGHGFSVTGSRGYMGQISNRLRLADWDSTRNVSIYRKFPTKLDSELEFKFDLQWIRGELEVFIDGNLMDTYSTAQNNVILNYTGTGSDVTISYKFLTGRVAPSNRASVVNIDNFSVTETTVQQTSNPPSNTFYKPGMIGQRYKFNGKEEINELGVNWQDYGARIYMPDIGRWNGIDVAADDHHEITPYNYAINNPVRFIDPNGMDTTIYVFDQPKQPTDDYEKANYTAIIFIDKDGYIIGPFIGSSYPDSKKNESETEFNTLDEGEHPFDNKSGHDGGTKKGLNLTNGDGDRESPGKDPDGKKVTIEYDNVHEGYDSRRFSEACITICPRDAGSFFENFDWSDGTKGNSKGTLILYKGGHADSYKKLIEITKKLEDQNKVVQQNVNNATGN